MEINYYNKGDLFGSYIYFIFAKDLIYVGETQKIAFIRWSGHLYGNGTLVKKIKEFGDPNVDYLSSLNYISINCFTIRQQFHEIRWKTITQAVEHSIHKILYSSQSQLIEAYYNKYEPSVDHYKIISDTSRTAPSSIPTNEWEFANDYASKVVSKICSSL